MSDENTWFALIHSDPNNSEHRLVFADWLEEQGDSDKATILRRHSEWPMLNRKRKSHIATVTVVGDDGDGDARNADDNGDGVAVGGGGGGDVSGDVGNADVEGDGDAATDVDVATVVGDADASSINSIKVTEMKSGEWYIVTRQSRYYYHILIGQVIVEGWEITMPEARSVRRIGSRDIVALATLGPDNGLVLREASHECLFRPELERVILTKAELWEGK